jgi:hypothetical protein
LIRAPYSNSFVITSCSYNVWQDWAVDHIVNFFSVAFKCFHWNSIIDCEVKESDQIVFASCDEFVLLHGVPGATKNFVWMAILFGHYKRLALRIVLDFNHDGGASRT